MEVDQLNQLNEYINNLYENNKKNDIVLNTKEHNLKEIYYLTKKLDLEKDNKFLMYIVRLFNYNQIYSIVFHKDNYYIKEIYNELQKINLNLESDTKSDTKTETKPKSTKCAVLIGINYSKTGKDLDGCENDTYLIKDLLINNYDFNEEDILVLTEKEKYIPTKKNIKNAFKWLLEKNKEGYNEIIIQYAGHGEYQDDRNSEEIDGQDEYLLTLDMRKITDDYMYKHFVKQLKDGTRVRCIFDCCHSGTIMDLKYKYLYKDEEEIDYYRKDHDIDIIVFSATRDNEESEETFFNNVNHGALTYFLNNALHLTNFKTSCFDLLDLVKISLKYDLFFQNPVLTSSKPITSDTLFL